VDHPAGVGPLTEPLIPTDLEASLVLVRHGESEYIVEGRFQGRAETPLSATGRRQAELVAARLARPHAAPAVPVPAGSPLAIVTSPLSRAASTAEAIATAMADETAFGRSVPVRPDPGFIEIGQGDWEGMLASDIGARDAERLAAWRRRPVETWAPGGEPITDVQARVRPALATLLAELAGAGPAGSIAAPQVSGYRTAPEHPWSVLVAHDGVFKVTLLTIFDVPLDHFWMWSFDLCGIAVVEFRAGRPVVRAMNLTEHLAPLLDEAAQAASEARARSGAL
jgi:phosphoserine phosphatase